MHAPSPRKNAPKLATIQREMTQAVFRRLGPGETMRRENAHIAETLIKPNDRLSSFERLQIYNQQYWWRLLGNFGEDFRGLRAVIGERKFDRLTIAYLESVGSNSWSLRDLGAALPTFIGKHPEFVAPHLALALEMARVEWARVLAFDGEERPVLDPARIAKTPPDRLRIGVQPYVTLFALNHPIDELLGKLRKANIETGSVSNAVSATRRQRTKRLAARPRNTPIHLAVHRHDFSVYYKRLEPGAFRILTALRDGATLDAACAASGELDPAPIQEWFANWMRLGWLCR